MKNRFHAILERDMDWYVAWCPEIPGADGQGKTKQKCLRNLGLAVQAILSDRLDDALRGFPEDALQKAILPG